jgi:hypothetical protein
MMIMALALSVKALVPTGYMIGTSSTMFMTVTICADGTGTHQTATIAVQKDEGQKDWGSKEKSGGHGKTDTPCAFTALSMASLGGADAPLLALALLFVLALGLAPRALSPLVDRAYLRPPLRGPPLFS